MRFNGRCHCGNLTVAFETEKTAPELALRACDCSFCRSHGARTTTDPEGRAVVVVRDPAKLNRYRFGLRTADFLVCGVCGVYVGAVHTEGGAAFVTLNVNAFDERAVFPSEATPVSFGGETADERRLRRGQRWTPAQVDIAPAREEGVI